MIESEHAKTVQEQKAKIRERYKGIDTSELECVPAKEAEDVFKSSRELRVAVYARVSTDDPRQTSSYELQKNHYLDVVSRNPNWKLVEIYADEGISGTSLMHRDAFKRMIEDCEKGKIDMIITKSVSRFARNIIDCIGYVRELQAMTPPVGVFFEAENIHTSNPNSEMTLSFMAAMAQEESHNKSEIMNASIEMRFRRGIFLTPPLLGYDLDEKGELVINEEEAKTVRLIFYMYLSGNTCQEIADTLTELKRPTKKGNIIWAPGSILQILQNERHCGDVLSRKTWTPNYLNHKSKKNKQNRNQYRKNGHHEAIISKDDFIAVQRLIRNARYGGKGILPELKVIADGALKGYTSINPRWAGFKACDYIAACQSIQPDAVQNDTNEVNAQAGEFDLRGFEVTRSQFMNPREKPYVLITPKMIKFNMNSLSQIPNAQYVELLINTNSQTLGVRSRPADSANSVPWAQMKNGRLVPREIASAAFIPTLYELCGWNPRYKYRCIGVSRHKDNENVLIFNLSETEIFIPKSDSGQDTDVPGSSPAPYFGATKSDIMGYPALWRHSFGNGYYYQAQAAELASFTRTGEWIIQSEGIAYQTDHLNVTTPDEARQHSSELINTMKDEYVNEHTI